MPKLTNTSRTEGVDFVVAGRNEDGSAKTEYLAPGETRDIEVLDSPPAQAMLAAHLNAGTLVAEESKHRRASRSTE